MVSNKRTGLGAFLLMVRPRKPIRARMGAARPPLTALRHAPEGELPRPPGRSAHPRQAKTIAGGTRTEPMPPNPRAADPPGALAQRDRPARGLGPARSASGTGYPACCTSRAKYRRVLPAAAAALAIVYAITSVHLKFTCNRLLPIGGDAVGIMTSVVIVTMWTSSPSGRRTR